MNAAISILNLSKKYLIIFLDRRQNILPSVKQSQNSVSVSLRNLKGKRTGIPLTGHKKEIWVF